MMDNAVPERPLPNILYYGDNLDVLRESIPAGSVDLIYLDPPFNSKQNYNLLYKTPKGHSSDAQVTAFKDSWSWAEQAEREFREVREGRNTALADLIVALRGFLREGDIMAYLTMMARRLIELHRVLKESGTLYLHCDPTASHYLKLLLDAVFGPKAFSNEIIWKRTTTKNDYRQGAVNWPRVHDVIFCYHKNRTGATYFNQPFAVYDESYTANFYKHIDADGRRFGLDNIAAPGRGMRGHPQYEFMGVTRYWRYGQAKMEELLAQGRIIQPKPGAVPRFKRYLDEMPGVAIGDVWTDIPPVQGASREFLGYPTQKPLALLERIVEASSKPGDVVLDPFCGCGTAIHAAQKLGRQWLGIDITHLAISLIEKRMHDAFPELSIRVEGRPRDIEAARDLARRDKYQFQDWACWLVGAQPYMGGKKGADRGIDGLIYFEDEPGSSRKIIVSVKGGASVGLTMLKDLQSTVETEGAVMGFFVTLAEPTEPMRKQAAAAGFFDSVKYKSYPKIQLLTIEGLMGATERPQFPNASAGQLTFMRAQKEKRRNTQGGLFKPKG